MGFTVLYSNASFRYLAPSSSIALPDSTSLVSVCIINTEYILAEGNKRSARLQYSFVMRQPNIALLEVQYNFLQAARLSASVQKIIQNSNKNNM